MRLLRLVLLALLGSLLFGLVVGTIIRMRLEKPVRYIGACDPVPRASALGSASPATPLDVAYAPALVLEPSPDEEQVG